MQKFLVIGSLLVLLVSCSRNQNHFKLTLTNDLKPEGIFPEYFEINSDKQMVFITNRFNTEGEKYQRTYFVEMSQNQFDTIVILIAQLFTTNFEYADSCLKYKLRYDVVKEGVAESNVLLGDEKNELLGKLFSYCMTLSESNKRYKLKQSYSFNTSEICIVKNHD